MSKLRSTLYIFLVCFSVFVFIGCSSKKVVNSDGVVKQDLKSYSDFDPTISYKYNGNNKYEKVITDYMVENATKSNADAVYIPIVLISKYDDKNIDDIKALGTCFIYGMKPESDMFKVVDKYSFNGCFHLEGKGSDFNVRYIEYALTGVNQNLSLFKMSDKDMTVVEDIIKTDDEYYERNIELFLKSTKDYVEQNNLNIKGIVNTDLNILYFDDNIDKKEKEEIYTIKNDIDKLISENYGSTGYTNIDFINKKLIRKMWRYGIGDAMDIFLDDSLDSEHKENYLEAWGSLVDSVVDATKVAKDLIDTHGNKDYHFEIQFLDDRDNKTVFVNAIDGEIVYNITEKD